MAFRRLPKTTQNRPKRLPRTSFFRPRFRPRFRYDFGRILAPKMPPFGHPFGAQNRSKKRSEIGLPPRSLQDRPKSAQDPPKTPPGPPRRAPGLPKRPPGPPSDAPRSPPGPPRTTQNVFRSIWPNNLFRKNRKIRNRRKKVEKKVDNGHPQWLPALVLTKTKSTFKTVEHRGWRRWSREALFNKKDISDMLLFFTLKLKHS